MASDNPNDTSNSSKGSGAQIPQATRYIFHFID
jgi:hypothetical protein